MQMISIKIVLDERSEKKDGTNPLKLRIVHSGQTYHISLGHSLLPQHWDEKNQRVKKSCRAISNLTRFNAILNSHKQEALDLLVKLQDEGTLNELPFSKIKFYLAKNTTETFVLEFCEEIIKELVQAKKIGNARVYRTMTSSLYTFLGGKDIPLKQINFSFLKKYEAWYLGKGNEVNGLSVHLRTLRAVINRAIKEKRLLQENNPFAEYRIKHEKTRKRAIKGEALQKIRHFQPTTKRQKRAQTYFMFSFLTIGASFIDIAFMKLSDIVDDRITYKRQKTGHLHSIPLSPELKVIINEVAGHKSGNAYIFDVISSDNPLIQSRQIRDELRRYNKTLKEIGQLCGVVTPLTSYVARHTYATLAKHKGVPTAIISEALGHSSEEITQVYLDSFDQSTIDEFHKLIIE